MKQDNLDKHRGVARRRQQHSDGKCQFERQHTPAADAIHPVAHEFAVGWFAARFGEQANAVICKQDEEHSGAEGVYYVGDVHRQLEEAHTSIGIEPAHLAREKHNAQPEDATQRRHHIIDSVVAHISD